MTGTVQSNFPFCRHKYDPVAVKILKHSAKETLVEKLAAVVTPPAGPGAAKAVSSNSSAVVTSSAKRKDLE
jgi:hypothetical protein